MLSPLLFFLLFETVQPSYATLVKMLPENVIMQASVLSAPSLNVNNAPFKKGDSIAPVIEAVLQDRQVLLLVCSKSGMLLYQNFLGILFGILLGSLVGLGIGMMQCLLVCMGRHSF